MAHIAPVADFGFFERLRRTLDMIKFEHSIFAMPFALTGALLAVRENHFNLESPWYKLFLIVCAMVTARSAGMTFNRILDERIDAKNPRTATRHLPAGLLSRSFALGFLVANCVLFAVVSYLLNPLCFLLSPVALIVVLFYSYTKRFTSLAHLVLGLSLGIAPSAAWIAITGTLDWRIGLLTLAVLFWTAGFDIIYACQDTDFDQQEGLHSIPARIGIANALLVSRVFHVLTVILLALLSQQFQLSIWPVIPVAALLLYEQSLVRAHDLSKVNIAFFTVNGFIGMSYFLSMAIEVYRNV
ncbi:UbiA-like polyprenyltransferase [Bryobacter aggregatus]|uniref:UbiA-like polyprenyltransferase n=1 Tax=Bryobacter aggregatus TaxID=360054 RepID=UPI0004E26BCF|nr:UbiA-like polyprenyltransferase [Bryobacter aggregatus]